MPFSSLAHGPLSLLRQRESERKLIPEAVVAQPLQLANQSFHRTATGTVALRRTHTRLANQALILAPRVHFLPPARVLGLLSLEWSTGESAS